VRDPFQSRLELALTADTSVALDVISAMLLDPRFAPLREFEV
jgi:hypothetical protein